MMFFNSLADGFKIIIIALCSLALIGEVFLACLLISRKKAKAISALQIIITLLCAINVIRLASGQGDPTGFFNSDIAVIIAIAINISLGTISLILALTEGSRVVVSSTDIPKYLEYSRDGVAFAHSSGRIVFSNNRMRELCSTLTGTELKNVNVFLDAISKIKTDKSVTVYDVNGKSVFRLADGTAWEFSRTQLDASHYLLTASDTTRVLEVAAEISEKKILIRETENQLQWTLDNIDELREQNRIAEQNEPIRTQISQLSHEICGSITSENPDKTLTFDSVIEPTGNRLSLISYAYEIIGVSISIIGNMPTDDALAPILLDFLNIAAAKSVALCNAKQITMAIYEGGSRLTANISCDGNAAKESPELFSNFEDRIKNLGGTLTIGYEPTLKLSVMLPK